MITQSVGSRGGKNLVQDVRRVQARLFDLGFTFVNIDGDGTSPYTIWAIRLFQSIINGESTTRNVDGRVDPGFTTHRWLMAENAPRWQMMNRRGDGFTNFERSDPEDTHDAGTSWVNQVIVDVAQSYHNEFLDNNPDKSNISINDVSMLFGGTSPDHSGHQTGLDVDLRLPRTDGRSGGIRWLRNGELTPAYDREAMRRQLTAFQNHDLVDLVFFNDTELIREGLCQRVAGHDDHVHISIKPPSRREVNSETDLVARLDEIIEDAREIF